VVDQAEPRSGACRR